MKPLTGLYRVPAASRSINGFAALARMTKRDIISRATYAGEAPEVSGGGILLVSNEDYELLGSWRSLLVLALAPDPRGKLLLSRLGGTFIDARTDGLVVSLLGLSGIPLVRPYGPGALRAVRDRVDAGRVVISPC